MNERRAAGFKGEIAVTASVEPPKSTLSNEVMACFFPPSYTSKFAAVSPRMGLPPESTTDTGTSTMRTLTVSCICAKADTATNRTVTATRRVIDLSLRLRALNLLLPNHGNARRLRFDDALFVYRDLQRRDLRRIV